MLRTRIGSVATSLGLHAAFVAGVLWMGIHLLSRPEIGVSQVPMPGDPDLNIRPPRPEEEKPDFKPRPDNAPPIQPDDSIPVEEFLIREMQEEAQPPPQRKSPPPPRLDPPMKPTAERRAPTAAVESPAAEIINAPPEYPILARRRGFEGTVVISFDILLDGSTGNLDVAESSGHLLLDEAGLRAVRDWRFTPALKDGRPVVSSRRVRFTFKLKD